MPGLGTIINCAAIIIGGLCGMLFGRFVKKQLQDALTCVCGISVIVIGLRGALTGIADKELLVIGCLSLGTLLGELCHIEQGFEKFGQWLKKKTHNEKDSSFVNGFVTASLTVSRGESNTDSPTAVLLFGFFLIFLALPQARLRHLRKHPKQNSLLWGAAQF